MTDELHLALAFRGVCKGSEFESDTEGVQAFLA